jgi:outer membrane lipopolysaccharide assembly protein LptE/RlpB
LLSGKTKMATTFFRCINSLVYKHILRMVCVGIMLFFLTGCGYHFSGSGGSRLPSSQSLWVSFIGIEIDSPSAQTVLRRSLLEEFHALRGLSPSGSEAASDLRVSGHLRSYAARAISYTALDLVKQYRLTIEVELELYRKGETVPFWKGTLQSYQDYPANSDLALQRSAEEAALAAAAHVLAQKLLMAVEQSY